jgi:hypothetical protein
MNYKQATKWVSSDWFQALASLLTLVTFVVGQSVYDVLSSNQEFLAVRQVSNLQLLQIVLVFNLLPALALFLLWALCRRFHHALARLFLSAVSFVLFLAFFLQLHNTYLPAWDPFPHAYLLWLFPALLVGLASLQFEKPFRAFLLALSPVVFLFPGLFLYHTWTNPQKLLPAVQERLPSSAKKDLPPIFILVFDELTVHALLDKQGQIDGSRFPNFKKLADESHWFRNTTTNAEHTVLAIPVILTGNYPRAVSASYENYPDNLLTLLHPYYDIYVYEVMTHLCEPRVFHCPDAEIGASRIELLRDVLYLYSTRLVPRGVDVGLPDMTRTWGPFRNARESIMARLGRFEKFMDFMDSLALRKGDNFFVFFHHMLPHSPYVLSAEGEIVDVSPHGFRARYVGNRGLMRDLVDRYLTQISYVDKELGRFVVKLEELGLYEKSLLIVMSDHGVSYRPEAPGRWLQPKPRVLGRRLREDGVPINADMVLTVPLFIKLPFQREGAFSEKGVQLIDITPTVADLLGLEISWPYVGRSILGSDEEPRRLVIHDKWGNRFEYPENLGLARVEVQFEEAPEWQGSTLIGQEVRSFETEKYKTVAGTLDRWSLTERSDGTSHIYANGWAILLENETVPDQLVVAINGKIMAVTTPRYERKGIVKRYKNEKFRKSGWYVSIPFPRRTIQSIAAYVVLDAGKGSLALLNTSRAATKKLAVQQRSSRRR